MYAQKEELTGSGESLAAKDIVSRVNDLAVLPHVVFKVLELSGSSDSAAADMERVITVDPAFSAKLLTHANSSYYGLGRKVTSIRDAVLYLGFKAVRDMALTVGVFDMFIGKNDKESLRRRGWWRHSVDSGVACKYLAERTHLLDPAEAYTCGLLHYIGKMLLDRFGQRDYTLVEQKMECAVPERQAELQIYGCDHIEVATLAGRKWGLPASVVSSFNYVSAPEESDEFSVYAACVALGSTVARRATDHEVSPDLPLWAMQELRLAPEAAQEICDRALERIASVTHMQF